MRSPVETHFRRAKTPSRSYRVVRDLERVEARVGGLAPTLHDVSLRLHVIGHKPLASALNDDVKTPSPTAVVTKETVGPSRCAATAGFFLWFAVCGEHNGERSYKDMVAV